MCVRHLDHRGDAGLEKFQTRPAGGFRRCQPGNTAPRRSPRGILRQCAGESGVGLWGRSGERWDDEGFRFDFQRDADGWCGLQIANLASGNIVQWIRIEGAESELYDVAVLPGVRRPMAASFTGPEINNPLTFEA